MLVKYVQFTILLQMVPVVARLDEMLIPCSQHEDVRVELHREKKNSGE